MRVSLFVAAVFVTAASAFAQTPIGPFTGQYQEGFDGPGVAFPQCMPGGVFGGTAQLCDALPGGGVHTTTSWGGSACTLFPHNGARFFGTTYGPAEYAFSTPATRFGGWFARNHQCADATVEFYDVSNNLLASIPISVPLDCNWYWHGWSIPGGASRIVVIGPCVNQGAYVMMDDMEVDYQPQGPVTYCTPGTTTNGCLAAISASGNPNVAHNNTCQLSVAGVEGQKSGILFYGLSQNVQPWCSIGGTSFLCVKSPTQRTIAQPSGGTAGACDGTLGLDWNAWQSSNPGALGQPFAAGNKVYVQGWFRDPPACKTTNMTDAVEMTYLP